MVRTRSSCGSISQRTRSRSRSVSIQGELLPSRLSRTSSTSSTNRRRGSTSNPVVPPHQDQDDNDFFDICSICSHLLYGREQWIAHQQLGNCSYSPELPPESESDSPEAQVVSVPNNAAVSSSSLDASTSASIVLAAPFDETQMDTTATVDLQIDKQQADNEVDMEDNISQHSDVEMTADQPFSDLNVDEPQFSVSTLGISANSLQQQERPLNIDIASLSAAPLGVIESAIQEPVVTASVPTPLSPLTSCAATPSPLESEETVSVDVGAFKELLKPNFTENQPPPTPTPPPSQSADCAPIVPSTASNEAPSIAVSSDLMESTPEAEPETPPSPPTPQEDILRPPIAAESQQLPESGNISNETAVAQAEEASSPAASSKQSQSRPVLLNRIKVEFDHSRDHEMIQQKKPKRRSSKKTPSPTSQNSSEPHPDPGSQSRLEVTSGNPASPEASVRFLNLSTVGKSLLATTQYEVIFQCIFCEFIDPNEEEVKQHTTTRHQDRILRRLTRCPACLNYFFDPDLLAAHFCQVHFQGPPPGGPAANNSSQ